MTIDNDNNNNDAKRSWSLATVIVLCMNAIIIVLVSLGHSLVMDRISSGDTVLLRRMDDFCDRMGKAEGRLHILEKDVSRIDTNQKARLDRELRGPVHER